MAVTQQLVRVPEAEVLRCSADRLALDNLISFRAAASNDTLDLDWAPSGLERLAAAYGFGLADALRVLLEGTAIVNTELAQGPQEYTVYSEIRWSTAIQVAAAAESLGRVETEALLRALPRKLEDARSFLGINDLPEGPRQYYADHFSRLRDFVNGAAERGLAIAMWWD